ncbi:hypothetical protein T484DRAFT_2027404, partial [Baffinella frigidus]
MAGTCNNEGRCRGDGSCNCFHGFVGAKCDTRGGGGDPAPGTTAGVTAAEPTTTTSTPEPTTTTSTTPEPDSDECALGNNNCDAHATCTNTAGSFSCACKTGYEGDGVNCTYVIECDDSPCGVGGNCTQGDPGTYSCDCSTGYEGDTDSVTCTDISECANDLHNNCDAHASCENTAGSFSCACDTGYSGDGVNCANDTECLSDSDNNCHVGSWCFGSTNYACPLHSSSEAGSSSLTDCECVARYVGPDGGTCGLCSPDHWCPGGNESEACAVNSSSPHGSSSQEECICVGGYQGEAGGPCTLCPADTYCASGTLSECPEHAASVSGSDNVTDCRCKTGFYGEDGDECSVCPANSYCEGGTSVVSCVAHSQSPTGSNSSEACTCEAGWYGPQGEACTLCEEDYWCWGGGKNSCPAHSMSRAGAMINTNCTCVVGYTGPDGGACTDIDECAQTPCGVRGTCSQGDPGTYSCDCSTGYAGDTDPVTCTDINECANDLHNNCDAHASCENTAGSFSCACDTGYSGDGVNCANDTECLSDSDNNCHAEAECTNTDGSFSCDCNAGYSGNGVSCTDIDECAQNPCGDNGDCTNNDTPGTNAYTCACHTGYEYTDGSCEDIDECNAKPCTDDNAACTNNDTPGTDAYSCTCNAGYENNSGSGADVDCTVINSAGTTAGETAAEPTMTTSTPEPTTTTSTTPEPGSDECARGTHNCDADATCTNTNGSFSCACDAGYSGNGVSCTDIDECAQNPCGGNGDCTNNDTPGIDAYTCECHTGYEYTGRSCEDIDECDSDPCGADATCTNTDGSFSCACDTGYSWDGETCTNVDECTDEIDNCHGNARCTDTDGSFSCACNTGYSGNGVSCTDINECFQEPCGAKGTCSQGDPGTYICACSTGYSAPSTGGTCEEIDECNVNLDNCDAEAKCTNTDGSFSCACDAGYYGNGVSCLRPPTAPLAVVVSQTTAPSAPGTLATRFGVVWSVPGDYGDGRAANNTDRTTLLGYNVVVWCGGGTRAAPILLNCSKGDTVSVEVSARNQHVAGPFSAAAEVTAMGLPGAVENVAASKVGLALHVNFQLPEDTGFGNSSSEAVLESVAQASTCSAFPRTGKCEFHETVNAGGGSPVVLTGLTNRTVYYVRAFVRNLVGDSPLADTPVILVDYFTLPNGAKQSNANIALKVFSLPSALTTADAVTGEFQFTTSATTTETKSVSTTASAANSAGSRTIAVPLPDDLPSFCASGCSATLFVYPASDASQVVSLPVEFFNYKRPAAKSVFPLEGSEQGGSLVTLTVEDYPGDAGKPSRLMAGLFSFIAAPELPVPTLHVEVSCAGEEVKKQAASLKDTGRSVFEIKFAAPPCDEGVANYTLATSSGNVLLDLGGFKALQFTYKGTVVSSVTPPSGMTNPGSGGVEITLFIDNVQTAPATTPNVTLAGVACTVGLATFSPGNNKLSIKARTPELSVARAGRVGFLVSGVVSGKDLAFEWSYTAPPAMFLEAATFTIDGDARTWVTASNAATFQIACVIRNLHAKYDRAFDALTLDIPQAGTQTMSFKRMGDSGKVVASFTLDTSTLSVDTMYSVHVGVYENGVSRFNVSAFDLGARTGAW